MTLCIEVITYTENIYNCYTVIRPILAYGAETAADKTKTTIENSLNECIKWCGGKMRTDDVRS
jgi:hypothetical protein